jgi:hypothetical protein
MLVALMDQAERLKLWAKLRGKRVLPLSPLAGSYGGTLLIIGTAECVTSDLKRVGYHDKVACVNRAISLRSPNFPDFWISKHNEVFDPGRPGHRNSGILLGEGVPFPTDKHTKIINGEMMVKEPYGTVFPSVRAMHSGVFACLAGLLLGFNKIITAGIPADNGRYFHSEEMPPETSDELIDQSWEMWREELEPYLFPMSGHLRSLFPASGGTIREGMYASGATPRR